MSQQKKTEITSKNISDTSFDPVLSDYAFFEQHATEKEEGLKAYARHLPSKREAPPTLRMLDFGAGSGSFTASLIRYMGWSPSSLKLTLVEPGEQARKEAMQRLSPLTAAEIVQYSELPEDLLSEFDLLLANHVCYFVADLPQTIYRLFQLKRPSGKLLVGLSGQENPLIQCWTYGFGLLRQSVPYFIANDLENVLKSLGLPYLKEEVPYILHFPDNRENRLKIIRFLFGRHLSEIPEQPLLQFFDHYSQQQEIEIHTQQRLYII